MTSLWFVVPAHGRAEMAAICLRQLAKTCATLNANGITASAVVIADDENLDTADDLGFATVERTNVLFGAKWNDGYQLAAQEGVDYVVPFGSDDWIDAEILLDGLPGPESMLCFRHATIVSEDGHRAVPLHIGYDGGIGIRVYPTSIFAPLRFRPAEEDKRKALDTSVFTAVTRSLGRIPDIRYGDLHPLQIIDWKSSETQLNSYADIAKIRGGDEHHVPWEALGGLYGSESVDAMRAFYRLRVEAAA